MKEDRLHIHLVHLEEVKPSEMPVDAHRRTRLLTGATVRHTYFHLHLRSLSLSLSLRFFLSLSLFLSLCLDACVSPPSAPCVLSKALISLVLARFCMYSHCLLSPVFQAYQTPFMCKGVFFSFFFLLPCRHAFIFPQLLIIKLFIIQASQAIDVPPLTERGTVSVIFA